MLGAVSTSRELGPGNGRKQPWACCSLRRILFDLSQALVFFRYQSNETCWWHPAIICWRYLATMIVSSRETVIRAFTELQEAGAVELRRRHIYIKDVEALELAAG